MENQCTAFCPSKKTQMAQINAATLPMKLDGIERSRRNDPTDRQKSAVD
jgi:hypothetical protein